MASFIAALTDPIWDALLMACSAAKSVKLYNSAATRYSTKYNIFPIRYMPKFAINTQTAVYTLTVSIKLESWIII